MPEHRPVGVFDSGVGGLSIVREIRRRMPELDLLYVSDARYLPYGERSEEFIRQRAFAIGDFLVGEDVRALVIACNTATAAAAREMRARYTLPIIGIEPAVKPATAATGSGIVGILATASTLQSRKYADLLERFGGFARVISQPCTGLVECVEAGELDGPRTRELLRGCVAPLLAAGADTLVLGCTHYSFLLDALRAVAGETVRIVDPGAAVARRLADLLDAGHGGAGTLRCWTSGDPVAQQASIARLIGVHADVAPLPAQFCAMPAMSGNRMESWPMSVTTWTLEMPQAADLRRAARNASLAVHECVEPQYELNRFLYSFVGAGWGWTDKLAWTEEQWKNWAENPQLRTWVGWCNGAPAGYFELQRQARDEVEIAYFGLAPRFIGRGLGGDLLSRAVECAWAWGARRVWVHTCSLDHPAALSNYQARGFMVCGMATC